MKVRKRQVKAAPGRVMEGDGSLVRDFSISVKYFQSP